MICRNTLLAMFGLSVPLVLAACGPAGKAANPPGEPAATLEEEAPVDIELAKLMGDMQHHSAKLGYAIAGHNHPLATFYLEEVHEVLGELMTVEADDGMPIAHPAGVILEPALEALESKLAAKQSWSEISYQYELVIESCNRCHLATEHGFIEILPARGEPPFNQRFAAAEDLHLDRPVR